MRKNIVVLGDVNLDLVFSGLKASPELGHELLAESCVQKVGGSCANTAILLRTLGWPVSLYGQIGDDHPANYLLGELAAMELDTSTISRSSSEATGITVACTYPTDRLYITAPGTIASLTLGMLPRGYLRANAHLHLASYFLQQALQADVGPLLRDAKAAGMSTSLDPGHDPLRGWSMDALQHFWDCMDFFLPNREEFLEITRSSSIDEAFERFPREVQTVVVKSGSEGALVRHRGVVSAIPGIAARVVDTSCAGDCFNAGFLYGVCGGASVHDAIQLGNSFGAAAVSVVGLPSAETLAMITSRRE